MNIIGLIMKEIQSINDLPSCHAVYALYGGVSQKYVAYVGNTSNLKRRIQQHLVGRDSSISTGTSATGLNPDYVTEVRWWEDHRFKINNAYLLASELAAFEILKPALRSRGAVKKEAETWYGYSGAKREMKRLFKGKPSGILTILTLDDLIQRIKKIEERMLRLEKRE